MTTTKPAKPLISRKEVASLIDPDMSTDQVRRNERRWGIDKARADLNPRCVRYRSIVVIQIFKGLGFVE